MKSIGWLSNPGSGLFAVNLLGQGVGVGNPGLISGNLQSQRILYRNNTLITIDTSAQSLFAHFITDTGIIVGDYNKGGGSEGSFVPAFWVEDPGSRARRWQPDVQPSVLLPQEPSAPHRSACHIFAVWRAKERTQRVDSGPRRRRPKGARRPLFELGSQRRFWARTLFYCIACGTPAAEERAWTPSYAGVAVMVQPIRSVAFPESVETAPAAASRSP